MTTVAVTTTKMYNPLISGDASAEVAYMGAKSLIYLTSSKCYMGIWTENFCIHMPKQNQMATSHVIAKYVQKQICPPNWAKYFTNIYGGCIHIYMPQVKSLEPIMQQWALYPYLAYITVKIWVAYSKYSSYSKHASWTYRPNIFAYIDQKHNQLQLLLYKLLLNVHIQFGIYAKYLMCTYGDIWSMCLFNYVLHKVVKKHKDDRWWLLETEFVPPKSAKNQLCFLNWKQNVTLI